MSRIKGKHTGPELKVAAALSLQKLDWENHVRELPGCPDFVFRSARVAVFVDGDFWHGWRFTVWQDKLSEKWEAKIAETRRRDARNHRRLRRMGWKVIRIWEHQISADIDVCISRVTQALRVEGPHKAAAWRNSPQPGKRKP